MAASSLGLRWSLRAARLAKECGALKAELSTKASEEAASQSSVGVRLQEARESAAAAEAAVVKRRPVLMEKLEQLTQEERAVLQRLAQIREQLAEVNAT